MINIMNTAILYMNVIKTVNFKSSYHKENIFFYFLNFVSI